MAAALKLLVLAFLSLLLLKTVLGQGPTRLTLTEQNSSAVPTESGAPALSLSFDPPTVQLTGFVDVNVIACGSAGLPSQVAIADTNISTAVPTVTVSARAIANVGRASLTNLSLNISTPNFPVNPANGSFNVTITNGTVFVATLNGSVSGNEFNQSQRTLPFQNQTAAVNGTFQATPGGNLQMNATSRVSIPLREIIDAAGFGNNSLITSVADGGVIEIPIFLVATGRDPCGGKRKLFV